MLTRKNDAVLDFDVEKVLEQSKDNPVFYVQYAHARTQSIIRNAVKLFPQFENETYLSNVNLSLLITENDINLIKNLALWPKIIEQSIIHSEPHRIAFYLQELAASFHSFWSDGKSNDNSKFIYQDNENLTKARIALVKTVALVIKIGLKIFNVEAINQM